MNCGIVLKGRPFVIRGRCCYSSEGWDGDLFVRRTAPRGSRFDTAFIEIRILIRSNQE